MRAIDTNIKNRDLSLNINISLSLSLSLSLSRARALSLSLSGEDSGAGGAAVLGVRRCGHLGISHHVPGKNSQKSSI
jgi:hypothetical protein